MIHVSYESVDTVQRALTTEVFQYATDKKKAAGRALGTLVEIIMFYTLRTWNLRDNIVIERSVPEFGNPDIVHNVEFSLHPVRTRSLLNIEEIKLPITAAKVKRHLPTLNATRVKSTSILTSDSLKRNATVLVENEFGPVVANVDSFDDSRCALTVCELAGDPFAIFECKRVGVEEGMRKGPQTIEKAKQGAYVARSVSSLQKLRMRDGQIRGFLETRDGQIRSGLYHDVLREIIDGDSVGDVGGFILTVGIVSNHGNWFTSDNHNKELRVLAQSYDWLLFLTDAGLCQFVDTTILNPKSELEPVRHAFLHSYSGAPSGNRFTKVRIDSAADDSLRMYFRTNENAIRAWFNVISPVGGTVDALRVDLDKLASKDW